MNSKTRLTSNLRISGCKNSLTRMYYSKEIQVFYVVLVFGCMIDLVIVCLYLNWDSDETWTLWFNLVLDIILITDSVLRIYMNKYDSCKSVKKVWIEATIILLSFAELVIIITYLFFDKNQTDGFKYTSIGLSCVITLLRCGIIWSYKQKSNIKSIHLPNSCVDDLHTVKCTEYNRIDQDYSDY
jgi:hypothetical protein